MAAIQNYKDLILQAYSPRFTPVTIPFVAPSVPVNLAITQTAIVSSSGDVAVVSILTWDDVPESYSTYTVAYRNTTDGETLYNSFDTYDNRAIIPVELAEKDIDVKVKANYGDTSSAFSTVLSYTTPKDTVAPTAPLNMTASNGYDIVSVAWDLPPEKDYKHTEIWASTIGNDRSIANLVAYAAGDNYKFADLPAGLTGHFWGRSVDTTGNLSDYYPVSATGGVEASTSQIPSEIPSTLPVPTASSVINHLSGTKDISLEWSAYVQGTVPARELIVYAYDSVLDSETTLLLNFDTDTSDTSGLNNVPTVTTATTIASGGQFGNCLSLSAASEYLQYDSTENFYFPADTDFQVDLWINATALPAAYYYPFDFSGLSLIILSTGVMQVYIFGLYIDIATIAISTDYAVSIRRSNGVVYMFVNHALSEIYRGTIATGGEAYSHRIGSGANTSAQYTFNGLIDSFKIVKGAYENDMDIVVPTVADSVAAGTEMLLHLDTDASDSSTNSATPVITGTVTIGAVTGSIGGAAYIDNTSGLSHIKSTLPSAFTLSTTYAIDFAVTIHAFPSSGYESFLSCTDFHFRIYSTGELYYAKGASVYSLGIIELDTRYHIRTSRNGDNFVIFLDGEIAYARDVTFTQVAFTDMYLGSSGAGTGVTCTIDEFHIVDGDARCFIDAGIPVPTEAPVRASPPPTWRDVTTADTAFVQPIDSTGMTFVGVNPESNYRAGIAAVRTDLEGIVYTTEIVQPKDPETPDWTFAGSAATIGGVPADELVNDVDTLVIDFDATNNTNYTAVVVPTVLSDTTAITHELKPDSTVDVTFTWAWTGDESEIDGFAIVVRYSLSDSATYTFGTTLAEEWVVQVPAENRTTLLKSLPSTAYISIAVVAFRKVNKDAALAPEGLLQTVYVSSTHASEIPYQPETTVIFDGDTVGVTDVTDIDTVVAAVLANDYVASDNGTISLGTLNAGGSTTVTSTLTTKPGASTVTNTWGEIIIAGKKYWMQLWEDVT